MNKHDVPSPDLAARLHEDRTRLETLIPQLATASEDCENAARPLEHLDDLDLEQRKQLADRIRAADEHWSAINEQVSEAMARIAAITGQQPGSANAKS
jgi:DNA repair exonuclease SbcCD ATPase subunit